MLLFKLIGAILLGLSGGMIAYELNKNATRALLQTEAFCRLLNHIRSQVECFALPIVDILSTADIELLRECGYTGKDAPTSLSKLYEGTHWRDSRTEMIIRRFSDEFGKSYRAEQVGRCSYYLSLLEERKRTAERELPAKKKLYLTLCTSASLAVLILFL